jgi:hypothetical protein
MDLADRASLSSQRATTSFGNEQRRLEADSGCFGSCDKIWVCYLGRNGRSSVDEPKGEGPIFGWELFRDSLCGAWESAALSKAKQEPRNPARDPRQSIRP